jgi:lysophospholipase L1-like esterase
VNPWNLLLKNEVNLMTLRPLFLPILLVAISTAGSTAEGRPDNAPPEGFVALFNGKDLSGWKGLVADPPHRAKMSREELAKEQEKADRRMREHWKAEDGVLVFDGKGDSLAAAKDYGDFELLVDWKILKDGDSGIYLRGSPQVQIWDRPEGSGGLYNNKKPENPSKPLTRADRAVGEWNTFRIRMVGEKVTIHLNDVLVVKDTVLENYWEPGKPIYPTGQIELQNHGNTLYFKNVYLKEIPRASTASSASSSPSPAAGRQPPALKKGARIAVVGDSITEQKLYSRYLEDYLVACLADLDLQVIQLGWGGERAPGFAARMDNDLLPYRPDLVTTCYGMNDGSYRPYEPAIGKTYEDSLRDIVRRLKAAGSTVVVGSPGAVDTTTFKNRSVTPALYNENLGHLRDIARTIAGEEGMPFANVHDPLVQAMEKAKVALGEAYHVCGGDGVHPAQNGQLVMAYSFLKGMGLDGNIGLITVDLKGQSTASEGHQMLSASGGKVEIESRRYPFCFSASDEEKSPSSPRSILPFVPFQDELNRLMLVVRNVGAARAKVTWGEASRSFTREELQAGINLAREFPRNPFSAPFAKVDEVVARKQAFETTLIKEVITRFRTIREILKDDPEGMAALDALRSRLMKKEEALAREVRAAVVPVRHLITIAEE